VRGLALGVLLLGAARPAAADDNHYQSLLVGERALGLGGAFVAISDDSSGAYYNPAGLAEAACSSFSLSAALYGFATQNHRIASAAFEGRNSSFVSYPTTAAWIQRVRKGNPDGSGRVQLALSLVTPQSDVARRRYAYRGAQVQVAPGVVRVPDLVTVQISEDDTFWIGLSAAWKLHRRLSLGGTLYTTVRTGLYQVYQDAIYRVLDQASGAESLRFAYADRLDLSLSHVALLGVVGAVVPVGERLRLAAAFRTPSLELRGRADMNRIFTPTDGAKFSVSTTQLDGATFRDRQPFKVTVGAAYLVPRRFGLALDLSLYGPVGEYSVVEHAADPSLAAGVRMKKRLVWQLGAGAELYLARTVPLRAGFFTNLSSLDRMEDCDAAGACVQHENIFTDGVDLYGLAASVGYEIDRASLNLGVSYSLGSRSVPLAGGAELTTDRSYLFVALGGSFRF
jgi:long-chain fatty acid transport protein